MKHTFYYLVFFISFSLFSCIGDDDVDPIGEATVSAKIDGKEWKAVRAVADYDGEKLVIRGIADNPVTITFSSLDLKQYTYSEGNEPGFYSLPLNYSVHKEDGSDNFTFAGTCTIAITAHDKERSAVSGTFSGKIKDFFGNEVHITEGKFTDVVYLSYDPEEREEEIAFKMDETNWELEPYTVLSPSHISIITIAGMDHSFYLNTVSISVPFDVKPGTYNLDGSKFVGAFSSVGLGKFTTTSGSITISKHDKDLRYVEGGFNFEATSANSGSAKSISDGSFKAYY
jgi:hypothetical protein